MLTCILFVLCLSCLLGCMVSDNGLLSNATHAELCRYWRLRSRLKRSPRWKRLMRTNPQLAERYEIQWSKSLFQPQPKASELQDRLADIAHETGNYDREYQIRRVTR